MSGRGIKSLLFACAAAGSFALTGCGNEPAETPEEAASSNTTLATLIGGAEDVSTIASTLSETGLAGVFDGAGAYTVLAPSDEAFAEASPEGVSLSEESNRPLAVAVIRQHIVPGFLTPDDIRAAIEGSEGGSVEMSSYADTAITFSMDGDTITATSADGQTARFSGQAGMASNGVMIPVDGVLAKVPSPTS